LIRASTDRFTESISIVRRNFMSNAVHATDLKVGDVLLYHSQGLISSMIRLLDGEPYSHASIFLGSENGTPSVAEMLGNGVNIRPLAESVSGAKFVDIHRYINDSHQPLGAAGVDPGPLVTKMRDFTAPENYERYGYEQILLLAMLCTTRKIDGVAGEIIRRILDNASEVLAAIIHAGKEPMICSELVYRCYTESNPPYDLLIVGSDIPRKLAFAAFNLDGLKLPGGQVAATPSQSADDAKTAAAVSAYLANYALAKGYSAPGRKRATTAIMTAEAPSSISSLTVADFVTPNDLGKSPNFQLLGTYSG
jgi:hypothetical protein